MPAKYLARQKILFFNVVGARKITIACKPLLYSVKCRLVYDRRVYILALAVGKGKISVVFAIRKPMIEGTPFERLAVQCKPFFVQLPCDFLFILAVCVLRKDKAYLPCA